MDVDFRYAALYAPNTQRRSTHDQAACPFRKGQAARKRRNRRYDGQADLGILLQMKTYAVNAAQEFV